VLGALWPVSICIVHDKCLLHYNYTYLLCRKVAGLARERGSVPICKDLPPLPRRRIYRGGFTEFPRVIIIALGYLPLWGNSKFYIRVRGLPAVNPKPSFSYIMDSTVPLNRSQAGSRLCSNTIQGASNYNQRCNYAAPGSRCTVHLAVHVSQEHSNLPPVTSPPLNRSQTGPRLCSNTIQFRRSRRIFQRGVSEIWNFA